MDSYRVIGSDGVIDWYKLGTRISHRENGPAVEYPNGDKEWYIDGELHREDGPAIECVNGTKRWYKEGKQHREDGPSVEWTNGNKYWYYEDIKINCDSQEMFERMLKLKAFW